MRITTIIIVLVSYLQSYSQTVIEMEKFNGVYKLECKINGIPMDFIFDTGASDVSISSTEALFLIKQGLIKNEDIIGNVNYKIANGKTLEGTKINIKTIEIKGLVLENVTATVVHELNSPLLLGQSVLSRLGRITIEENQLIIHNENTVTIKNTEKEIKETIEWLNQKIQKYQFDSLEFKVEYQLSFEKYKGEFFMIILQDYFMAGGKKPFNKYKTFIPISEISSISFKKRGVGLEVDTKYNKAGYVLKISTKNNNHKITEERTTYLFGESTIETKNISEYYINLERSIDSENLQERIIKAFNYLKVLTKKEVIEKF